MSTRQYKTSESEYSSSRDRGEAKHQLDIRQQIRAGETYGVLSRSACPNRCISSPTYLVA